jgi:transposase
MRQVTQIDFSGQRIYAGIDVHKKSWKVSIRSQYMELQTFSQNPSAEDLIGHLRGRYPGADYQVVYEAGFCGFSPERTFRAAGIHCLVVNPADVPTTDKEQQRKSDGVDCRKLSRTLSEGSLRGIHIPTVEQQDDRSVIRAYHQLVKDQTRYKNRIKSWLYFQGIAIPDEHSGWSNNFTQWLTELVLSASARASLDLLLNGYTNARAMVASATLQVRSLSRQQQYKETIKLLRTIPGIGQIAALLFAVEIGDINRFKRVEQLCDFVGLVPRIHQSGERETTLGLTRRGHHKLRETLIEASWVAVRLDPAMTAFFGQATRRMIKNRAIIKVARKLLNRIRYVLRNRQEYVKAVVR